MSKIVLLSEIVEHPSSHPALREFRKMAARMTAPPGVEPLKKILAVGVPFDRKHGFLARRDPAFIKNVFENLAAAKIPVSPNFVFTPYDMRYNQDFLDPRNNCATDVLVFSFIASPDHPARSQKPSAACFSLSPFDKGIGSWAEAAQRTQAKIIISYSVTEHDINVECFRSPFHAARYQGLPLPAHQTLVHDARAIIRKDYALELQRFRSAAGESTSPEGNGNRRPSFVNRIASLFGRLRPSGNER